MAAAYNSEPVTYSLYRILELRPPCTDEDITRAYRKLALKYHPDKPTGSAEKFQKIKKAHEILKDPVKREYYDKFGDKGLGMLLPDSMDGHFFGDTSNFLGRTTLKLMTRPTRLIPVFLALAGLAILFIMFLNRLDRKLYGTDLKTTPWGHIFSILLIDILVFFLVIGFMLAIKVKDVKVLFNYMFDSNQLQNIPTPRRRFLAIILVIMDIMGSLQILVGTVIFVYFNLSLSLYLNDEGGLKAGMTWTTMFYPSVVFFITFGVVDVILNVFNILRYHAPDRMWKERSLVFTYAVYSSISSVAFLHYFSEWLDSTYRYQMNLFLIFSLLYFRIIFHGIRTYCKYTWKAKDDLENIRNRNFTNGSEEEYKQSLKRRRSFTSNFIYTMIVFSSLSLGLIHSHIAGNWPQTWAGALFPLWFSAYMSTVVFGCCCPCILSCMELMTPPNLFGTIPPYTGEEQVTIIEIVSCYRFGYGLAPIQRRITHHPQ